MVGVVDHWFHGLASWHKERALCPDGPPSFVSPARKSISWRKSPTLIPRPKPRRSAAGSAYAAAARTAPPTSRWPRRSAATPAPSANGGDASRSNGLPAGPTALAAVLRGLFPPEDRPKVIVLATTKPA